MSSRGQAQAVTHTGKDRILSWVPGDQPHQLRVTVEFDALDPDVSRWINLQGYIAAVKSSAVGSENSKAPVDGVVSTAASFLQDGGSLADGAVVTAPLTDLLRDTLQLVH